MVEMQDLHCYEENYFFSKAVTIIYCRLFLQKNAELDFNRSYTPIQGGYAELSCCESRHVCPSG